MTTELPEFVAKLQRLQTLYLLLKQDIDSFTNRIRITTGVMQVSGVTSTLRASPTFEGVRVILKENEETDRLTNIAIITFLRTVWEDFVEKDFDDLNIHVEEIWLIRDCFIHNRGGVSRNLAKFYTKNPEKNARGYKIDDPILLKREHIEEYFRTIESAYSEYLIKKRALPLF